MGGRWVKLNVLSAKGWEQEGRFYEKFIKGELGIKVENV